MKFSTYTQAWLAWIVQFLVIEGNAIFTKNYEGTLSQHIWSWFGIKDKPRGYKARRAGLAAFLAWLVIHLLTGGWA